MVRPTSRALLLAVLAAGTTSVAQLHGQETGATSFANYVSTDYGVDANVTYLTASGVDLKLDFYRPRNRPATPRPTMIFFHGGGYLTMAKKEPSVLNMLPWIQRGWNAVNVEYRPTSVALAPAALEDARCALRWVIENAKQYEVDIDRIVLSGQSAGGHLALAAGMVPATDGFDQNCPGAPMKVAAIVNWYGVWDHSALLKDPTLGWWVVKWLGGQADREELAARVSPLTHVRAGLPPTISIHGDADPAIPHAQATRGTAALQAAGVMTRLITIPGGKHGNFERKEVQRAWAAIDAFLAANSLAKVSGAEIAGR